MRTRRFVLPLVALLSTLGAQAHPDPLPSWNAGTHKQAIVVFVRATTTKGGPWFVPAAGAGARLCLYVHHTDADREYAYDRTSEIGKLDKGLDDAAKRAWTVVDMKSDWKTIYPPKR